MKNKAQFMYLVFSHTNTKMSRFIRTMTNYEYNHVSLSFSSGLDPLYSFARKYRDTPFYGGFVRETSARFNSGGTAATVRICAIPLSAIQLRTAQNYINKISRNGDKYLYNTISAITNPLHHRVNIDRAFTCVEFAIAVLKLIGAPLSNRIPRFCSIEQLNDIYAPMLIYQGNLQSPEDTRGYIDNYLDKNPMYYRVRKTVSSNARLFGRLCRKLWHKAF